jgi:hypothetical protein
MFPLKLRKVGGYRFGEKTFYSAHHLGTDYSATYAELYAPFSGEIISETNGTQGGLTILFKPDGQNVAMRFMHLSEFKHGTGRVTEGQLIAITGNSGSATTAPHLHLDITKNWSGAFWNDFNNFIDPETFKWEDDMIPQDKLTDRFYHTSDGKALYWIPDPEIGNKFLPGWADNKPVDSIVPEIGQLHAQIDDLTIKLKTIEDTKNDLQTQVSTLSTEKQQIGDKTREELYNQFTMEKDLLTKEHDNEVENITESYSLKIQQLEDELKKKETCKQSTGQSNTGKTLFKSIWEWLASHR